MRAQLAAAIAASVLLASCNGGGSGKQFTNVVPPAGNPGTVVPAQKLTITGVGDSLTAGTQSGGTMGADLPVLGTNPQLGQIGPVQRTQEHGFFSLLWQQANGVDINTMSDPAKSPLPLLIPPGVGGLLAPTTSGFPFPVSNTCDAKQLPANQFSTALSLRENPAVNPWDVGVPGVTMHEALFMNGAIGDCGINPTNAPPTFVALNALVNGESQNFWPILAGFGPGVTMVDAAVSLHAQVATVYLGSNDLLKVAFSGGAAPVAAPQSIHDDVKAIIQKLQGAGSKVAVANLVDVMSAATFISRPAYQPTLQAYITGVLEAPPNNVPPAFAVPIATQYSTAYAAQEAAQVGFGTSTNGYFTINALFKTLQTAAAQIPVHAQPVAPTLGAGDFIAGAVADNVKALNLAYSQAITLAVSETGAALVDTYKDFQAVKAAGGVPVNPPKCCSIVYRGGFFSLDGLHPSNTGYAILANEFIDALNAKYGLGIPDVSVATVYATDPYAPGNGVSGFSVTRLAK
jgi:lysophospholipase L1-like esterase